MSAKTFFLTSILLLGMGVLIAGCGSDSSPVTIDDNEAPILPPQNVQVIPTPDGRVIVTWDANTQSHLSGYNVYRNEDGFGIQKLNGSPLTVTRYEDTSAQRTVQYEYWVTSVSAKGAESTFTAHQVMIPEYDPGDKRRREI